MVGDCTLVLLLGRAQIVLIMNALCVLSVAFVVVLFMMRSCLSFVPSLVFIMFESSDAS